MKFITPTLSHEKLFAGKHNLATFRILYAHSFGLQHFFINSLLYLKMIQDRYIALYRELITQLHTYVSAIRVLAKGYLPNKLIKPAKLETVPVQILDKNTKAQSYTHLQVGKPYITLNSETYVSLRQQELRSCKRIGYECYCEELFIVKHKSSYSLKVPFTST